MVNLQLKIKRKIKSHNSTKMETMLLKKNSMKRSRINRAVKSPKKEAKGSDLDCLL